MDIKHMAQMCKNDDEIFSLLYPPCVLAGLDVDEVIADCKDIALREKNTVMSIALDYRQYICTQLLTDNNHRSVATT